MSSLRRIERRRSGRELCRNLRGLRQQVQSGFSNLISSLFFGVNPLKEQELLKGLNEIREELDPVIDHLCDVGHTLNADRLIGIRDQLLPKLEPKIEEGGSRDVIVDKEIVRISDGKSIVRIIWYKEGTRLIKKIMLNDLPIWIDPNIADPDTE